MIEILNLEYDVSGYKILKNTNLSLREKRIGIIGANGSGKSTLIKIIKGLLSPTKGNVFFQGKDVHVRGGHLKNKIGYVFQDPDHQIIMPIVEEDIAFGLKKSGLNKSAIRDKAIHTLKTYHLEKLIGRNTYHLSGGEKQLVAVAGVLAMDPEVMIFDEPTTMLDLKNKNRLQVLIQQLTQPVIMVTHDFNLLQGFDRVIVLDEGEIVLDDVPKNAIEYYVNAMASQV